jgi:hypothetical protein
VKTISAHTKSTGLIFRTIKNIYHPYKFQKESKAKLKLVLATVILYQGLTKLTTFKTILSGATVPLIAGIG